MPTFLRRLRARIKYRHFERDLAREIEVHREMAAERFANDGADAGEARAQASRLLGNTALAREDSRATWLPRQLQHLAQDLRYGLRGLQRQVGFTITAVLTIGVGIGVLVGLFTVFNTVYLRQWPLAEPSGIFGISLSAQLPKPNADRIPGFSVPQFDALRAATASADLIAKREVNVDLRPTAAGSGRTGRVALVSDDFLRVAGLRFFMGSPFSADSAPSIVLTHAAWDVSLSRDPLALGRTIYLDKVPVIVTGVLDPSFQGFPPKGPLQGFVALRHAALIRARDADLLTNPAACCVEVIGRLRPGWSRASSAQELAPKINAIRNGYGIEPVELRTWNTAGANRPSGVRSGVGELFALLFAGCVLVTLLACANIGNLQLARGLRRQREIAVRLSLGASRRRVIRQLMTESGLVALLGCGVALVIAWWVPAEILAADTAGTANVYAPDATVIAFAFAAGILATIGFGLAPAMRVTRFDWRGATGSVLPGASRLRSVLLAVQIALSLGVVGSATLLTRAVVHTLGGADAGFNFQRLAVVAPVLPPGAYDSAGARALTAQLAAALRDKPGMAWAETTPWANIVGADRASLPNVPQPTNVETFPMSSAIFAVAGVPIVAGRAHNEAVPSEVVINQALASALWPGESPLDRTFVLQRGKITLTVVGVIGDARFADITADVPVVIRSREGRVTVPKILIHAEQEQAARAVLRSLDPRIKVAVRPVARDLRNTLRGSVMGASIASALGVLALLLAGLGVFGVFAYVVEERRQEIGLRLALGASAGQLRRAIAAVTARPLIIGLTTGLALSITGGFLLRGFLFGLSAVDPLSYLAAAAIMAAAALAATFAPLRRALRVSPAATLRQD